MPYNTSLPPRRRFKKRYIAYGVVVSYIVMCQACMTMRSTPRETKSFFTKASLPFDDKIFAYQGHTLHYIGTGDPELPVLLFVHGSPGSWNAFQDYLKDSLLLQKYRLIAIDRPGFGYSDFGKVMNLKDQAQLIGHFVESIRNGKPVSLVGHSLGSPLILQMAALSHEKYSHLVVIAGSVDPKAETSERWRPIIGAFPLRFLIPGAMRPSNDELWLLKQDLFKLQRDLGKVTSNVVIVHGDDDSLVPFSNAAYMEAELSQANTELFAIKGAGHFIVWTHFKKLRDILAELE